MQEGTFGSDVQNPGERLTLDQATERAAVSVGTLRRWIRSGRLQAVKVGGKWLTTKNAMFRAMFRVR